MNSITTLLSKSINDGAAAGDEGKKIIAGPVYQLLGCVSVMASKHIQSLKHMEHTPSLSLLLTKLLSPSYSNTPSLPLPNLIMIACKCFYTFAQQSEKFQQSMLDNGTIIYLIYLAVFYQAQPSINNINNASPSSSPALAPVPAPAVPNNDSNNNDASSSSSAAAAAEAAATPAAAADNNDESKSSSDSSSLSAEIDWTNKIRLGSGYVLSALMSNAQSNKRLQIIMEGLLGVSNYKTLINPTEFLTRIHTSPPSAAINKKWKESLYRYMESQMNLITLAGKWQGYTPENFKFQLSEDA